MSQKADHPKAEQDAMNTRTGKNARYQRFVQEYLIDFNATRAAKAAGYSEKTAGSQGFDLLKTPEIQALIDQERTILSEALRFTVQDAVRRYVDIATADPTELTRIERGCCRHCWGEDHEYQWRSDREFAKAMLEYQAIPDKKKHLVQQPHQAGGFGYTFRREPNPECPECDGQGTYRVFLADTSTVSPQARKLLAGIKKTRDGIEVKMHDQMHALDQVARHLGVFEKEAEGNNALATALAEFVRSSSKAGSPPAFGDDRLDGDED